MGLVSGIVVYIMLWWVIVFTILPIGVSTNYSVQTGNATSAPQNPHLLLKFILTTVLAGLVWFAVNEIIQSGLITFEIDEL